MKLSHSEENVSAFLDCSSCLSDVTSFLSAEVFPFVLFLFIITFHSIEVKIYQ